MNWVAHDVIQSILVYLRIMKIKQRSVRTDKTGMNSSSLLDILNVNIDFDLFTNHESFRRGLDIHQSLVQYTCSMSEYHR